MAEVVRQRQRLGQVFVEAEDAADRAGDLRDLDAVGQARAVVIALMVDEHLGLVLQAAEGAGVDDAVAVALERVRVALSGSATRRPRLSSGLAGNRVEPLGGRRTWPDSTRRGQPRQFCRLHGLTKLIQVLT